MTLAISILALLIALGCLSVVVILIFRVSAFAEEVDKLDKSTKNAIEGVRLSVEDMERESYKEDPERGNRPDDEDHDNEREVTD